MAASFSEHVLSITGAVQHKRAAAAVLANSDYVPKAGEIIGATDTGEMKFGDGTHTWSELPAYDGTQIVNAYNSDSTTAGLSAAKGKDLNTRLESFEDLVGIDCGEITIPVSNDPDPDPDPEQQG